MRSLGWAKSNRRGWLTLTVAGMGLFCLLSVRPARSGGEWVQGRRMAKAVANVMAAARTVNDLSDYGYDDGICILGAYVRHGASASITCSLKADERYLLLGGGDDYAEDVDIHLLNADGKEVASDTDTDATPVVRYTPKYAGKYTLRLTLYKARGSEFCALAIMREDGWDVPVSNLVEATGKCIVAGALINDEVGNAVFHEEPNQWSFFGAVMREGDSVSLTNMKMERRRHAIMATCDGVADDIDLALLDNQDRVFIEDTGPESVASVVYRTGDHASYGVRLKNEKSSGASLVVAAILDL